MEGSKGLSKELIRSAVVATVEGRRWVRDIAWGGGRNIPALRTGGGIT
jgi:hypothetical protein